MSKNVRVTIIWPRLVEYFEAMRKAGESDRSG